MTGTNGKTSTTFLVESILRDAGRRVGLIGTIEVRYADERQRAVNTTPESLDLQRTLRAMRSRGVDAVSMEVSSHGLALGRVEGCRFAAAALTNVTQDHLDFHGDMEHYVEAKLLLFRRHLRPGAAAVVNAEDPSAERFLAAAREAGVRALRVSRKDPAAEIYVERADVRLDGTRAALRIPGGPLELQIPLIGEFNVENVAVAIAAAAEDGDEPAGRERAQRAQQLLDRVGRVRVVDQHGRRARQIRAHALDAARHLRAAGDTARDRLVRDAEADRDADRDRDVLDVELADQRDL